MIVMISIPRQQYRHIRSHLFKGQEEQGCFLFVETVFDHAVVNLYVKEVYTVKADKWDHQSSFHLELADEEKVKVMLKARRYQYDLIECHSHRTNGIADFSQTDVHGLDEFIRYVWWKLPGRIYGAIVWTHNDVAGQVWLPQKATALPLREIRIIS